MMSLPHFQIKSISLLLFLLIGQNGLSQDIEKYFFNRGNIAKLTANITKDLSTDEDKVLAIHQWITHHIKWKDSKTFESKKKTVKKALFKRKGPAEAYVVLFDEMCQFAKIESEIVRGNVTPEFSANYNPRAFEISNHSWNAVKINAEWFLIDVTFDAGFMEKKKYRVKKFIEKTIVIPFPGGAKRFYFIKKKSKFVHEPSQDFYLKNKEMMETHFPLMPMWQLSKDTISSNIYRQKPWERKAHLDTSTGGYEYDYNKQIDDYIFSVHPDLVEGSEGNEHNDTNFVALAKGEIKFVDKSINLFNQKPVNEESEIKDRLIEVDTLFSTLKKGKGHVKKALQIEKKIYSANNKVHKTRNKLVTNENRKRLSKLSSIQKKTIQLAIQLKKENKRILEKSETHEKKVEKHEKWSPSFKEKKPVSQKEYKKTIKSLTTLFSKEPVIKERMDSLESEFNNQLKEDFTLLKKNIIDSLKQETSWVSKCKTTVENYDHNQDSTYFADRDRVESLHLDHMLLTDSLIKKFIRLQKKTLSNYKKELSNINNIKKEAYTLLKNIYSNGNNDDYIDELKHLNEVYIERLSNLADFKLKIEARNNTFIYWFKLYKREIKTAQTEYLSESGKENLRLKADIAYESGLYRKQARKILSIQKLEKSVQPKLKLEKAELKDLLKGYK